VRDLLRVVRNKRHHFHELSADVRTRLALDLPAGFLAYFESRFPALLLRGVEVACRFLAAERDFAPYCRVIAPLFQHVPTPPQGAKADVVAAGGDAAAAPQPQPQPSLSATDAPPREASGPGDGAGDADNAALAVGTGDGDAATATTTAAPATAAGVADGVVVWQHGALAQSLGCRGWWRLSLTHPDDVWTDSAQKGTGGGNGGGAAGNGQGANKAKTAASHLTRSSTDFKCVSYPLSPFRRTPSEAVSSLVFLLF